jgi:hypothetical protein
MSDEIRLLQFVVCKEFREEKQDHFNARGVHSNIAVTKFPTSLPGHCVVTCWRKDKKFHKELVEFETADGTKTRTPHTDVEPVTDTVMFRWHKHAFPRDLVIKAETLLTIRVILDNRAQFETYILVEKKFK